MFGATRAAIRRLGIMQELLSFMWQQKLWWMIPMVALLLFVGILMIFAQSSAIAPILYTLY